MTPKPVAAREVRLTKLDAEGRPTGEPVTVTGPAIASLDAADLYDHSGDLTDLAPDGQVLPTPGDSVTIEVTDPDPVAAYLLSGGLVGHPPIPTAYRAEWWPAAVRLPGQPQPISLAKVYATAEGLYVYDEAPSTGDPNGIRPKFYSPILYDKTPRPATGYAARQAGIKLTTAAGDVIVQQLTGCGCAKRALGNWRPGWGSRIESWEA
jgi:hypothetical protein